MEKEPNIQTLGYERVVRIKWKWNRLAFITFALGVCSWPLILLLSVLKSEMQFKASEISPVIMLLVFGAVWASGIIALFQIRRADGEERGRQFAICGMLAPLGWFIVVCWIALFVRY